MTVTTCSTCAQPAECVVCGAPATIRFVEPRQKPGDSRPDDEHMHFDFCAIHRAEAEGIRAQLETTRRYAKIVQAESYDQAILDAKRSLSPMKPLSAPEPPESAQRTLPSTPEELHEFVCDYNADSGIDGLLWVIRHPQCDRGTALSIFWSADPSYYYEQYATLAEAQADNADGGYPGLVAMLFEIEERMEAGFYRSERIAFDPLAGLVPSDIDRMRQANATGKRRIPDSLWRPVD